MRFETKSTEAALVANKRSGDILTPWHVIVDTDKQTVTIQKRNKTLIGVDEQVFAFRFVRNVSIDEHLIGADVAIRMSSGVAKAYCIPKKDAKKIRDIILEYNAKRKRATIIG